VEPAGTVEVKSVSDGFETTTLSENPDPSLSKLLSILMMMDDKLDWSREYECDILTSTSDRSLLKRKSITRNTTRWTRLDYMILM
jgi:hypothetical protein